MRLIIGAFEAGFYPTVVGYLSCFYRRYDLAVRLALFYGQYAIAGAFSGSIGTLHERTEIASIKLTFPTSIWSVSSRRRRAVYLAVSLHHRRWFDCCHGSGCLVLAPRRAGICLVSQRGGAGLGDVAHRERQYRLYSARMRQQWHRKGSIDQARSARDS
jgi:hypothetical protein